MFIYMYVIIMYMYLNIYIYTYVYALFRLSLLGGCLIAFREVVICTYIYVHLYMYMYMYIYACFILVESPWRLFNSIQRGIYMLI
jgi:hypothetical protein